jgi:hypothetical protein
MLFSVRILFWQKTVAQLSGTRQNQQVKDLDTSWMPKPLKEVWQPVVLLPRRNHLFYNNHPFAQPQLKLLWYSKLSDH